MGFMSEKLQFCYNIAKSLGIHLQFVFLKSEFT